VSGFRFAIGQDALRDQLRRALPSADEAELAALSVLWSERDRQLEDYLKAHEVVFSYAGALATATSPPYPLRGTLREITIGLGTAGTSDTVVTPKRGSTSLATITLGSGITTKTVYYRERFASEVLTLTITTVGTGAADLSAVTKDA
jgi:hypothetical protein